MRGKRWNVTRAVSFTIERVGPGLSRAGVLKTPHGNVRTPAFVAVATKATVKGIDPARFADLGIQCVIANTYHLYLSPGGQAVEAAGGVGTFMGFPGPTMTDSGGFQVFSLGEGMGKMGSKVLPEGVGEAHGLRERSEEITTSHGKLAVVDDDGVSFTSHLDGSLHRFTPERSIEIQHQLGADVIFAFDECASPTADKEYQREAMERTHRWAQRSLDAHRLRGERSNSQGIFGIVQGGRHEDLRIASARTLASMDFDGYGIGGSFRKDDILGILEKVNAELPAEKPRHLLGIGEPEDIFIGVSSGIDTFDCVLPTRNGRNGTVYTFDGKIHITRAEHAGRFSPVDPECDCFVCEEHTAGYLHHLFDSGEMLGPILASAHNIRFLTRLTERVRESVINGTFEAYRDEFLRRYLA